MKREEWIPVEEKPPEINQMVLVFQDYGDHNRYLVTKWTTEVNNFYEMNSITHWMPLPEPPEQVPRAAIDAS